MKHTHSSILLAFTFSARRIPAKSLARTLPRPLRSTPARQSRAVAKAPASPRSGRYPTSFSPGGSMTQDWGREGEEDTSIVVS